MTKNYVKLLVVTNNEKNLKKQMKITLFIELINEFTNFINLIQARPRKARGTFISKINSISRPRRSYQSDHSFLFFDDFSKTEVDSFKTRDRSTHRMQSFMKFKPHHSFTIRTATLIADFSTKHVKTNDKLFVIETESSIDRKSIKK